jgi:hypothetical protein
MIERAEWDQVSAGALIEKAGAASGSPVVESCSIPNLSRLHLRGGG